LRHAYEIIPGKTPCRLYFDVEFARGTALESNAQIHGDELVDRLIKEAGKHLNRCFGLPVPARHDVVDMDSSTPSKFSRHLVFHLRPAVSLTKKSSPAAANREFLFRSSDHVGAFVRSLAAELILAQPSLLGDEVPSQPGAPHPLWVRHPPRQAASGDVCASQEVLSLSSSQEGTLDTSQEPRTRAPAQPEPLWSCVIDLGVYTKNRAFRLLGSRKFGREKPALRLADENQFVQHDGPSLASSQEMAIFGDSLVVPCFIVNDQQQLLEMPIPGQSFLPGSSSTHDLSSLVVSPAQSWGLPLHCLQSGDRTSLALALCERLKVPSQLSPAVSVGAAFDGQRAGGEQQGAIRRWQGDGRGSPFPPIDEFLLDLVCGRSRGEPDMCGGGLSGCSAGSLRSWRLTHVSDDHTREGAFASTAADGFSSLCGRWTLVTAISHNYRFCERIGRPHKSNNVAIGVSLTVLARSGEPVETSRLRVDGGWRQRCFDPECRDFAFEMRPLPPSVLGRLEGLLVSRPRCLL